jgi:hypothetical protein
VHEITAIIGTIEALAAIRQAWPRVVVVSLEQGLGIIGLDEHTATLLTGRPVDVGDLEQLGAPEEYSKRIDGVLQAIRERGIGGALGVIATQYFGGSGTQAALLAINGTIAVGPLVGDGAINQILEALGVRRSGRVGDEFELAGLSRWRGTSEIGTTSG